MSSPPSKRQKREEYRRAQAEAHLQRENADDIKLPKKRFYRQRAHANPFSDHRLSYPISPAHMDWSPHYPAFVDPNVSETTLSGAPKLIKDVEVVDIGCGFGGLLVSLAPVMPETLMVGMEIRPSVLEYVTTRIQALRAQQKHLASRDSTSVPPPTPPPPSQPLDERPVTPSSPSTTTPATTATTSTTSTSTSATLVPGNYENISAIRSNTMKFLPNFFARHQLSKIFICFPDPHFKQRKHKARIISEALNAEYAYVLRPGGLLYTITDVEEYHQWILKHFHQDSEKDGNPSSLSEESSGGDDVGGGGIRDLWERVSDEEIQQDECARIMRDATEESKKVTRNKGNKYVAVFRRRADPEWPA